MEDKEIIEILKKNKELMQHVETTGFLSAIIHVLIHNSLIKEEEIIKLKDMYVEKGLEKHVKEMTEEERKTFETIHNSIFGSFLGM